MKFIFQLVILLSFGFHASAITTYFEGHYNNVSPDTVTTESKTGTFSGLTFSTNNNTLTHEDDSVFGFELGIDNLKIPNIRIGFSYLKPHIKLKSSTINGSVTNGSTTLSGAGIITPADWASIGISFDNDIELRMLNLYYDFDYNEKFKPFLGFGVGYADIQNTDGSELTTSFTGGAKYYLNETSYLGAKINWASISGPTDKLFGIKYNDIDVFTSTLLIGFEF
ncbi:hypothetical protein N9J61_00300 [Pelagibacterales bacterium]|nr:hypothetical protein [Pelagibacterales bacterium]